MRPTPRCVSSPRYLFSGHEGLAAARRVDATIGRLPGLAGLPLLEAWLAADAERSAA